MAVRKTSKKPVLKSGPKTLKTPKSAYTNTVEMSDDSMAPIFSKGDLVTIEGAIVQQEGDYVLVRTMGREAVFKIDGKLFAHELHVIRRLKYIDDLGRAKYVPENPAYPVMLEDEVWTNLECLGPVTSVRHVDGTVETFAPSTRTRVDYDYLQE
jgi:SOS-response transcriptional repressor LexA